MDAYLELRTQPIAVAIASASLNLVWAARVVRQGNTTRASKIRRVAGQRGLETQFAPQASQAEQSAAEQRNCRAAIGDSRRSNADVVQKEEASSAKLYRRKSARGGEIKRVLSVARWPCKNMIENCWTPQNAKRTPARRGRPKVDRIRLAQCRRERLPKNARTRSTKRLKASRMRRYAAGRTHGEKAGVQRPAGKIACFKSRISNQICLSGMGNWKSRSCAYSE